jgi:hypothetical protein
MKAGMITSPMLICSNSLADKKEASMKVKTDLRAGKGLGDAVADFTQQTGLDQLASTYTQLTGKDCGCKARQAKLNQLVPSFMSS